MRNTEKHVWHLGDGVWVSVDVSGVMSAKNIEALNKYIALAFEVEPAVGKVPEPTSSEAEVLK